MLPCAPRTLTRQAARPLALVPVQALQALEEALAASGGAHADLEAAGAAGAAFVSHVLHPVLTGHGRRAALEAALPSRRRRGAAAALLEADRAFLDEHLVAPCGSLFVESRTRAGSFIASEEVAEELRELGLYARLCDASGAPLTFDRDTVEPAVRVAHAMAHMLIEHPVRCLARVLS